jgi:hypothetical protein
MILPRLHRHGLVRLCLENQQARTENSAGRSRQAFSAQGDEGFHEVQVRGDEASLFDAPTTISLLSATHDSKYRFAVDILERKIDLMRY